MTFKPTILSALVLFPLANAGAAVSVTNGDFESAGIARTSSTDSNLRDFVDHNLVSSTSGWFTSNNADKTFNLTTGGPSAGNYAANGPGGATGNHRSILNVIQDGKSTVGEVTMTIDLLMLVQGGGENLLLKVWGVNDSDAITPGIQWDGVFDLTGPAGNPDGLDIRDIGEASNVTSTYTGSSFERILNTNAAGLGATAGTSWNTGLEFTYDLGATGYDQIVIGFAMHDSPTGGTLSGIDNLTVVPEPSSALLVTSFLGLGLLRRRRN